MLALVRHQTLLKSRKLLRSRSHLCPKYHSTFEITYTGFILGEFNFVIISAKITVQNSVMNYFCNFPCFLQISISLVAAAMGSKPGRAEDPLFPQKKPSLEWPPIRSVCCDGPLARRTTALCFWPLSSHKILEIAAFWWLSSQRKTRISSILTVHVAKISRIQYFDSQQTLEIPAFWPCMS